MAVPAPKTWVASELVDAAEANLEWRDALNFLLNTPHTFAYRSAAKSCSDGVWTLYDMDTELYDSHAAHSTSTNNSRLIAPETGIYFCKASVRWASGTASTYRALQIKKNAGGVEANGTRLTIEVETAVGGGEVTVFGVEVDTPLNAGDYIELFVRQATGAGALNVDFGAEYSFLSFRWVSKL